MRDQPRSVHLSRQIPAPPPAVWSILTDVHRLPDISPSTVEVDGPARLERTGDRFEQTVRLAGKRFTSEWRVERFEAERVIRVAGSVLPGTHYAMTEEVAPGPGGTTTLDLTIEYRLPFGPLGRLAAKLGAERTALSEARQVLDGIARLATTDPSTDDAPGTSAPVHPRRP